MKRSRAVRLTVVASASASASACAGPGARPQAMHCVEPATSRVVADSLCDRSPATRGGGRSGTIGASPGASGEFGAADTTPAGAPRRAVGGSGFSPGFLWYYGGRTASGFVSAGGFTPREGIAYESPGGYAARGGGVRGFFGRLAARAGGATHGSVTRGGFGATGAAHAGGAGS